MKTALRLPRDLHAQVQEAAKANSRSMNAEIVARLQASFEQGAPITTEDLTRLFDAQHERLMASVQEAVAAAKAPPSTAGN